MLQRKNMLIAIKFALILQVVSYRSLSAPIDEGIKCIDHVFVKGNMDDVDAFELEQSTCCENLMKLQFSRDHHGVGCKFRINHDSIELIALDQEQGSYSDCISAVHGCFDLKLDDILRDEEDERMDIKVETTVAEDNITQEPQYSYDPESICDEEDLPAFGGDYCKSNPTEKFIMDMGFSRVCIYKTANLKKEKRFLCTQICISYKTPFGQLGEMICDEMKEDFDGIAVPLIMPGSNIDDYREPKVCKSHLETFCLPTKEGHLHTTHQIRWGNEDKKIVVKINSTCFQVCYDEDCKFSVESSPLKVKVTAKSKLGYYHIGMNKEHREGFFVGEKDVEFDIDEEGLYNMVATCNAIKTKRVIIITNNELCDARWHGHLYLIHNIYCKNKRTMNNLFLGIIGLSSMYLLHEAFAFVLGSILACAMFLFVYVVFWKYYCKSCLEVRFRKNHRCSPRKCPFCSTELEISREASSVERKREMDIHLRRCKGAKFNTTWFVCLKTCFFFVYNPVNYILAKLPKFTLGLMLLIILSYFMPSAFAHNVVDDISDKLIERTRANKYDTKNMCSNFYSILIGSALFTVLSLLILLAFTNFLQMKRKLMSSHNIMGTYCLAHDEYVTRSLTEKNHKNCIKIQGYKIIDDQVCYDDLLFKNDLRDKGNIELMILNLLRLSAGFKLIFILMILFCLVETMSCVDHIQEMSRVEEDLGNFIKDLKKTGFHPYHGRFTGGARKRLSELNEKMNCDKGICSLQMEIEADMIIKPGKEFGYIIESKNLSIAQNLNIKVLEPKSICVYKDLYKTGRVMHKSASSDTCTENCKECFKQIDKELGASRGQGNTIHRQQHDDSSSWACDGSGCMSMGTGCTCIECWCDLEDEKWEVKKLISEVHTFEICIVIGTEGFCKNVLEEERNDILSVLSLSKGKNCPEIVACQNGVNCRTGDINEMDQNFEKFGTVKKVGNNIISYKQIEAEEICHFARSRYYVLRKCCHDTFHLLETLKNTPLHKIKANSYELPASALGAWKLRIKLPKLRFVQKIDDVEIKASGIVKCKGCHSCDEGGSCVMEFFSNLPTIMEFSCNECGTDINTVNVKKGNNISPFNIFCAKKEGVVNCMIGSIKISGQYNLLEEPRVPHGDGIINVDTTKQIQSECDHILCGFGLPSMDIFGKLKTTIILVVIFFSICIIVYLTINMFKLFKM